MGAGGQAYLAMFTGHPLPRPRLLGAGMLGVAGLSGLLQLAMVALGGVYSWEVMLALWCAGVPGAYLLAVGDTPDPETGRSRKSQRVGLIASFVLGVVLAFAASAVLVHVVGIEAW